MPPLLSKIADSAACPNRVEFRTDRWECNLCCQSFDFKRPSVATLREKPVEIAETEGRLLKALEGRPTCA